MPFCLQRNDSNDSIGNDIRILCNHRVVLYEIIGNFEKKLNAIVIHSLSWQIKAA